MMIEKKYVVPEGMLKVFGEAYDHQKGLGANREGCEKAGMEAALGWLAENPIVPTEAQLTEMLATRIGFGFEPVDWMRWGAAQFQRRMFLAPEPEVPEEIKDLLSTRYVDDITFGGIAKEHNENIIEAFRRGQKSRK